MCRDCGAWEEVDELPDSWGNVVLAMGEMRTDGGHARLHYTEIFSFIVGVDSGFHGSSSLNLDAFLPLRARLRQRFPAAAQLSDVQLLLLLTCTTLPWPIDMGEAATCCASEDYASIVSIVGDQFAHVEQMPGHPDTPRVPERDGVPSGMEEDISYTGGFSYVDGLPLDTTLTPAFLAAVEAKLALVTQFHVGQADKREKETR